MENLKTGQLASRLRKRLSEPAMLDLIVGAVIDSHSELRLPSLRLRVGNRTVCQAQRATL